MLAGAGTAAGGECAHEGGAALGTLAGCGHNCGCASGADDVSVLVCGDRILSLSLLDLLLGEGTNANVAPQYELQYCCSV